MNKISGNNRPASNKFLFVLIIFTSLTVPGQPLPQFHVEVWLPFRYHEMDHYKN